MLDRLLSSIPGSRAYRRHAAVMAKVEALGAALRPATDPAAMELAIQQIVQAGRTENAAAANAQGEPQLRPTLIRGSPSDPVLTGHPHTAQGELKE